MMRDRKPLALVTGASRGIGLATAERLASEGWRVIAADRDQAALEAQGERWRTGSLSIIPEVLDVTDRNAVGALLDWHPGVELVVNNAGISGPVGPVGGVERDAFLAVLSVNVAGVFIVAQEAMRRMQPGGAIVNIASCVYLASPNVVHYGMTKGAVIALTRSMALEGFRRGISVNAVGPGAIDTVMQESLSDEQRARLAALLPNGKPLDPDVIAAAVAHFASPEGRLAQGEALIVDAGLMLGVSKW